jgi:hypothetical protein
MSGKRMIRAPIRGEGFKYKLYACRACLKISDMATREATALAVTIWFVAAGVRLLLQPSSWKSVRVPG